MLPVAFKGAGAAAAGAIVVLAVAAGSAGGLPAGAGWAAAAGAFACVSGLVLGTGGRRAPAAAFGIAAVTALAIAPTGGDELRAAPRVLAMKAPADSERLRGNASPTPRGENPTGAKSDAAPARRDASPAESDATPARGDDSAAERAGSVEEGVRNRTRRFRGDVSARLEALVRAYYADLDTRRYEAAWARLAPAVQRGFGGFETWRSGYETTLGHAVEDLATTRNGVTHTLVASCGQASGRYAVSWRFEGAQAVAVTAEALSGSAC